jgi:hypothetical protein
VGCQQRGPPPLEPLLLHALPAVPGEAVVKVLQASLQQSAFPGGEKAW